MSGRPDLAAPERSIGAWSLSSRRTNEGTRNNDGYPAAWANRRLGMLEVPFSERQTVSEPAGVQVGLEPSVQPCTKRPPRGPNQGLNTISPTPCRDARSATKAGVPDSPIGSAHDDCN